MDTLKSNWHKEELAKIFSEGVRGSIPGATLQLEIIAKLINYWNPSPLKILDLGCGDGILGRVLHSQFQLAHTVFTDFSEPMLKKVQKKIGEDNNIAIVLSDFSNSNWTKAIESDTPFDIIVSGFAIHHQTDTRKKALYSEIFSLLNEGGIFLNLDQVSSKTKKTGKIFDSFFLEYVQKSLPQSNAKENMKQIEKAYYDDKKENIPAPIETQCQWLYDIGFQEVDCFLKTFELALFGGIKNTTSKNN